MIIKILEKIPMLLLDKTELSTADEIAFWACIITLIGLWVSIFFNFKTLKIVKKTFVHESRAYFAFDSISYKIIKETEPFKICYIEPEIIFCNVGKSILKYKIESLKLSTNNGDAIFINFKSEAKNVFPNCSEKIPCGSIENISLSKRLEALIEVRIAYSNLDDDNMKYITEKTVKFNLSSIRPVISDFEVIAQYDN